MSGIERPELSGLDELLNLVIKLLSYLTPKLPRNNTKEKT